MKIAVVGATGLVGNKMLQILQERNFPVKELLLAASEKSVGKSLIFKEKEYFVQHIEKVISQKPDIALFSAGGEVSKQFAPLFAQNGTFVIDNSSAWRMEKNIPLIVPEINAEILTKNDKIIANPNCSTIQLVMILAPLHKKFSLKRIVVSTYQSVTGTGMKAVRQLEDERNGISPTMIYPHKIDKNCIPQCDVFTENGYTKEEMKIINETRKILNLPELQITATTARIPVLGGHSESVNIEFEKDFSISEIFEIFSKTQGVVLQDNISQNIYPMPLLSAERDEVFVGRIRKDFSQKNSLNLWVVADNLRKGAATNAVQIAEYLLENHLV